MNNKQWIWNKRIFANWTQKLGLLYEWQWSEKCYKCMRWACNRWRMKFGILHDFGGHFYLNLNLPFTVSSINDIVSVWPDFFRRKDYKWTRKGLPETTLHFSRDYAAFLAFLALFTGINVDMFLNNPFFIVSLKFNFCKVYRGLGKPAELKTLKEYVQCTRFSSGRNVFMRIILRIIFYKLTIILNPQKLHFW